jgi:hypothetical protein
MLVHAALPLSWIVLMAQILGLLAAWAARRAEGSRHQTSCHRLFFVALILVGGATTAAIGLGPGYWLVCGTCFSVMVVGAVCEFRHNEQVAES